MAAVKDYYELLGLGKEASIDDIKKAYRKFARKYHPDLNPGDKAAEEKFKEINEAYSVLGDPKKKEEYDRFGKTPFEAGQGFGAGYGAPPFEDIFEFGFGDIFSDVLGGGRKAEVYRGSDIVAEIEVSLEEAFTGVTRHFTVQKESGCKKCGGTGAESSDICRKCNGTGRLTASRGFFRMAQPCDECRGTGRKVTKICGICRGEGRVFEAESLDVRIPPGVDNGSIMRIRGMGNAGAGGGPPGDIRLRIAVRPHRLFERKDRDLYIKLPVTFGEAALGAKIEVPTIDGTAVMTIPPGTQGDQRFKLKGKGFVGQGGGARGDMYVDMSIAVPKNIGKELESHIKKIDSAYGEDPRRRFKQ